MYKWSVIKSIRKPQRKRLKYHKLTANTLVFLCSGIFFMNVSPSV